MAAAMAAGLGLPQARAAEGTWIQIEAKRDMAAAEARARDWQGAFPGVTGFRLPSGWYGLALGPYDAAGAAAAMAALKSAARIPADSYIVDGAAYRDPFWPGTGAAPAAPETPPPPPRAETPAEARRAEQAMPPEARAEIQTALRWAGFDAGPADGAFGAGTRAAIAAWQAAQGMEATGALTTPQRGALLTPYRAGIAALGLTEVTDGPAGIAAILPMGLVEPVRYAPPFARHEAKDGSGVTLFLVSSPLASDYDIVAARIAALMPGAEISQGPGLLTARLADGDQRGEARVEIGDGLLKGWILTWPAARAQEMAHVAQVLRDSFRALPGRALDPTHDRQTEAERAALRTGLEPRSPIRSRSGIALGAGHVATTVEAVEGCRRLTADGAGAEVIARNQGLGLALLSAALPGPGAPLAPAAVAGEVMVSGYSTGPAMAAPAAIHARAAAAEGGRSRLSARIFPGDGGGPVLDTGGRVAGMVLTPARGEPAAALAAPALRQALDAAGIAVNAEPAAAAPLPPARLTEAARAATVRILCWD